MVDLSIIYSKTGKGLRARTALVAGISTQQLKVLSFIDGKSKAQAILTQSNEFTEKDLTAALSQLEINGFIRPLAKAQSNAEDWALTANFSPMVVEEFKNMDDIEAETQAKAQQEQQEAERIASEKAQEKIRWKAEINARKQAEAKEKAEAEVKEKTRLEQARIARETAEAQKKAEAEAKLKAAEEARLVAERIARAENQAQLDAARKAKAELKAQAAAELERAKLAEKQKAEAETEAQAKESARLEMARVVRQAEEERKLAEAAANEARQAAKQQAKAEEQARSKAARAAKDDEKQARIDAEAAEKSHIAQPESVEHKMDNLAPAAKEAKNITQETISHDADINQQIAPPQSDLLANKVAEQQADLQALEKAERIRAKNEADEKAALDAKELAKQEMARIAREADDLRSQADNQVVAKPTKSRRFEASGTAKLKKTTQTPQNKESRHQVAETQAREAEKRAYIALMEKQSAAKKQEEIQEEIQVEIKAPIKTKTLPIDLSSLLFKCLKWIAKLAKITLVYGCLLALLLIGILHFINISPLIAPIEKLASDSLGKPVHIEQVHASLWPQPHLTLDNLAIGDTLQARSIQVIPDAFTLFDDVKQLKSLTIQGLVIEQNNVDESLQAIQHIGKAPLFKIGQLNVSDLSFKLNDLTLGSFDAKLALNEAGELNYADLHSVDNTLTAQIKPQGADYALTLTGTKWALPLNPNIVFDELKASASIHQNQMTFSQIDGAMFGGNISAKAELDWSGGWHTTGSFTLTNASAPQLLKAFASKGSVDGKANLRGDFTSQSSKALKLTNTPTITANIALKNGKINGVDLQRALMAHQNAALAGQATHFDKLSANLHVQDGEYHYKQIALETSQFHANGNVEIAQNQAVAGRINAALNAETRRLQANFGLSGTIDHVKRQ